MRAMIEKATASGRAPGIGGLLARWAGTVAGRLRANRVAPALSGDSARAWGVGSEWRPLSYGEYYPRSVPVYAAIRLRGESVARTPLVVRRTASASSGSGFPLPPGEGQGEGQRQGFPAGADHAMQRLLDMPNPF